MRGAAGFESFYTEHFGERWARLKAALTEPSPKVRLLNPFYGDLDSAGGDFVFGKEFPVKILRSGEDGPAPKGGLSAHYGLDLASVLAACALPLSAGMRWLDMCAAPGGKALTKIFSLNGDVETVANDVSAARVQRLKAVFHDHLPEAVLAKTKVIRRDAARWRARGEEYDSILVDAPCSAEHHLLARPRILDEWSVKRSKTLAIRQHTLLCSALELVKVGGHILYSTCSVSPFENDAVIKRFLEKRGGRVRLIEAPVWVGERSPCGVEIHPDKFGTGPIFYSLLRREG